MVRTGNLNNTEGHGGLGQCKIVQKRLGSVDQRAQ